MKQDILAPPKVSLPTYRKAVIVLLLVVVVVQIALTVAGMYTVGELIINICGVAVIGVVTVLLYAALLRRARRAKPEHMPLIHAIVGAMTMIAICSTVAIATPLGGLLMNSVWWQVAMLFGITLASGGWKRRVGESTHCPQCEYEFLFDDPATAPTRCPECGASWLGRLRKGRPLKSRRTMTLGITIAALSVVVFNPAFYLPALAPHLPTPLLYAALYVAPASVFSAWDELASRPLDGASINRMASRVLRVRQNSLIDPSPGRWLEAMMPTGKIQPELATRFYEESFRGELIVPAHVKAGESFNASLRIKRALSGKGSMGVMFGGYALGDSPQRQGRGDHTMWAYEMHPGLFCRSKDVFPSVLKAEQPGNVFVHVTYWVVWEPSMTDELVWQRDGTPSTPSNAAWFKRVDLEKAVHVE